MPEVTVDKYVVEDLDLEVAVIKIRESRGRSWATCIIAEIPSRSGGESHHVKIFRKNPPECTCEAMKYGKLCHATELLALIADDNDFWK